ATGVDASYFLGLRRRRRAPRGPRRGQVGDQPGQLAVGPGGHGLFQPLVEFLGGQPAVPGGHPQQLDHPVPVVVGGAQFAAGDLAARLGFRHEANCIAGTGPAARAPRGCLHGPQCLVLTGPSRLRWAHTVGSQGTPLVSAAALPQAPGVYRFRDRAGRVLYIGRAVSLRRRVLSYWGDLGDRAHLAPMVARIARVEAVTRDSAHEAAGLERDLPQHRRPPWNRTPGGQEAEVWIRLSASPRRPGLTVVRQPAPGDFGPYLGGQKVRDAVSGLGRVLPLGYAGDLRAATARDMAP